MDLERPREEGPVAVGALGERLLVEVLEGVRVVLLQLVALDLSPDHPVEGIRRLREGSSHKLVMCRVAEDTDFFLKGSVLNDDYHKFYSKSETLNIVVW